ncbi:MAG: hypothetical protein K8R25_02570 [Methanosarcinales archaeon]|nr:hypothetical protein [Methanosarcinales archaeon]
MFKGINLTLMIGPAVPVPVPKEVLDALTVVEVTANAGQSSGFQLTFNLSNHSSLHTIFLLSGGSSIPLIRVIIIVTINGTPEVLMDGVMTNHEVTPGPDQGHSSLTVTGEDLSRVMDYIDFSGTPFPAMPPEARVALMLVKYAGFGIAPMIVPSVMIDVPVPTEHIPVQQGTDLCYIRQLAQDVGYVFYVEPGPKPGMSIAYWGPEIKVGRPQSALSINVDAHTNVEALNFNFNPSRKLPIINIQDQATKAVITIPVPDITPLNPPLGLLPPIPKETEPIEGTAKLSPVRAALIGLAKAARMADAVSGSGSLDVLRYGHILKAGKLVGVRGAGPAFDGLYYVKKVTHSIKRGEYKQSFNLTRNGLISTVQRVPV